jgi:serine protease Do
MSRYLCSFLAMLAFAATAARAQVPQSFSPIIEPLMPAVVNISTTQKINASGPLAFDFNGLPDDPQTRQFKELFKQFSEQYGNEPAREVTSLGSGFVIDPAGYIVTNNHVIANAENITVIFADDTHLSATLVGIDAKTDLALLKVKPDHKIPYVRWGDSDALKVGDWVIAIGNPFGLGGSVSSGIVSARGRNINAGPFDDFIQTDAAINRGNSGGPLFNMKGEVVGINAAIFSPTGSNVGIGFAVPSAMAHGIIDQLRSTGKIHRGWLGVKIQEVTDEIANSIGMNQARGAMVLDVAGPATKSGIQPGDVIVRYDGHEIRQMHILPRLVAETKVGRKVTIGVWRKGKEIPYEVTLGELPGEKDRKAGAENAPQGGDSGDDGLGLSSRNAVLGMVVVPITPELRLQTGLSKEARGLLVTDIDPAGQGAKRGVLAGDVIVAINQVPVESVKTLRSGLDEAKRAGRDFALLRIERRHTVQFIAVPTTEGGTKKK